MDEGFVAVSHKWTYHHLRREACYQLHQQSCWWNKMIFASDKGISIFCKWITDNCNAPGGTSWQQWSWLHSSRCSATFRHITRSDSCPKRRALTMSHSSSRWLLDPNYATPLSTNTSVAFSHCSPIISQLPVVIANSPSILCWHRCFTAAFHHASHYH